MIRYGSTPDFFLESLEVPDESVLIEAGDSLSRNGVFFKSKNRLRKGVALTGWLEAEESPSLAAWHKDQKKIQTCKKIPNIS